MIEIRTEEEYQRALKEIEGLMRAKRGTPEGERLDALARPTQARSVTPQACGTRN